jgi:hypothetical protein
MICFTVLHQHLARAPGANIRFDLLCDHDARRWHKLGISINFRNFELTVQVSGFLQLPKEAAAIILQVDKLIKRSKGQ